MGLRLAVWFVFDFRFVCCFRLLGLLCVAIVFGLLLYAVLVIVG